MFECSINEAYLARLSHFAYNFKFYKSQSPTHVCLYLFSDAKLLLIFGFLYKYIETFKSNDCNEELKSIYLKMQSWLAFEIFKMQHYPFESSISTLLDSYVH